jgi:hypothetical protein
MAAKRTADGMRKDCPELRLAPRSTAEDQDFLKTFFCASRLHFLGTWKIRIEQLMRRWGVDPSAQLLAKDFLFTSGSGRKQPQDRLAPPSLPPSARLFMPPQASRMWNGGR